MMINKHMKRSTISLIFKKLEIFLLGGHCAKLNYPVTKKTNTVCFHLYEILSQNYRHKKYNSGCQGLGGRKHGELLSTELQFYNLKRIIELSGSDSYTALGMYIQRPLNCIHLKIG